MTMAQEQRTIIITGGNSGMGRAMAEAFAHAGAHIAIIGRAQDTLRETAEALAPHVAWYQANVSQRQQVQTVVANIVEQRGHVDVLTPTMLSLEDDRIMIYWSLCIPMPDIPENSPQVSHDRTYQHRYR